MPAAWVSAGVAAYSAYSANKRSKAAGGGTAQGAADPFAPQREQYQTKLNDLMGGNFGPTDPSYQWRMSQGLEGVNRSAAASGMLNSGQRLAQLMDYGQNQASTEYSNQYQRLAQLSGANIGSPAVAGQMQANQEGRTSAFYQQLAGKAGDAIKSWYNGQQSTDGGLGGNSDGSGYTGNDGDAGVDSGSQLDTSGWT